MKGKLFSLNLGKDFPTFAVLFLVGGLGLALETDPHVFGFEVGIRWLNGVGAGLMVMGAFMVGGIVNAICDKLEDIEKAVKDKTPDKPV